jgi:hypothetical protein
MNLKSGKLNKKSLDKANPNSIKIIVKTMGDLEYLIKYTIS